MEDSLSVISGSGSTASSTVSHKLFFLLGWESVWAWVWEGLGSSSGVGATTGSGLPHIDEGFLSFFLPKPSIRAAGSPADTCDCGLDSKFSRAGFGSGVVPTPNNRATESQEDRRREGDSCFNSAGGRDLTGSAFVAISAIAAGGSTDDFVGSFGFADGLR